VQNPPHNLLGSTRVWYNNLEPNSIEGFNDLYVKLVECFNINILAEKSSMKLFGVIQQESEFTRAYLKRYNEKMLKVKEILESITLKALIKGVREHAI